ncbi:VOC family protein [Lusitaniella coriacea LEGE 07157]|uniref:VOC family protein n=1 Tax=Lusitaniella coriacea LEGE 07157 TaxID=945747 RepID=A0A8J7E043_9CYAN|nr:VOC family protein [Lusitaniella coriacea]MBE9118021.1 VOC family protein [Lusitaniella coriacea LEGE 07157]
MEIQQCLHTTILTRDLAKAEHFYGEVLGLTPVERTPKFPGTWYQVGDYQIHLIVDPHFTAPLHHAQKWGRNPHIAFCVADINRAIATLTQHNFPFQMSASGRPALFVRDPDGNVLELSGSLPPQS